MEPDLFAGSYELIDAVRREARADPTTLVTVDEVAARVGWRTGDVSRGLEALGRAGVLQWAEVGDGARRYLRVTAYGLGFLDPGHVPLPPRPEREPRNPSPARPTFIPMEQRTR